MLPPSAGEEVLGWVFIRFKRPSGEGLENGRMDVNITVQVSNKETVLVE